MATAVDATCMTRSLLDRTPCTCGNPACDGSIVIRQKCHRGAGARVVYQPATGTVALICSECNTGFARMQLAAEVPS